MRFWRRLLKHIRRWNCWRKCNKNGKFHKLMVLFGGHSPTFDTMGLMEEFYPVDNLIVDDPYFTKLEVVDLRTDRIEAIEMNRE